MQCFPEPWLSLIIYGGCQVRILSGHLYGHQAAPRKTELPGIKGPAQGSWDPRQDKLSENLRTAGWYIGTPWMCNSSPFQTLSHFILALLFIVLKVTNTLSKAAGNLGIGGKTSQSEKHLFCSIGTGQTQVSWVTTGTLDWMFKYSHFRFGSFAYQPLRGFLGKWYHSFIHSFTLSFISSAKLTNIY